MSDPVRAAVEAAVGTGLSAWSGPRRRAWSWHFSGQTRSGVALIVKVPRWEEVPDLEAALQAGAQDDTRAEFMALEAIHDAVAVADDPGLAAVTPVAYLPEVNAIVMERLAARSMGERLGFRCRDAEEVFRRLGSWLDLYHGLHPVVVGPQTPRKPPTGEPSRSMAALAERVTDLRERLGESEVPSGVTHGDLTMGNILVTDDDRVAVIDPNRIPGPLTADGAQLLAETRVGRRQLVTAGLRWSPEEIDTWAAAMAGAQSRIDPAVARLAEAEAVLSRWAAFLAERRALASRRFADRVFSRALTRLLDGA